MSDTGTPSWLRPDSVTSQSQALDFYVKLLMGQANHAFLAKVIACSNSGQVAAPGTVDVMPLLNQLRADGTIVPPSPVYGLPYVRVQSGQSAIICDPIPNVDIGIAIVCDRDISSLKNNFTLSNPGSLRQNSKSDGIFIGLALGRTAPTQFIQMLMDTMGNPQGINIVTPQALTWRASNSTLDPSGNVTFSGTGKFTGDVTASGNNISVENHTHGGVSAGEAQTDPPTEGT
jgi:hypothetical protein